MSVTPASANIYVNQGASIASAAQGEAQAKTEFANVIAGQLANENEREVAEIRPTEEVYKIDPENEQERRGGQNGGEEALAQNEVRDEDENAQEDDSLEPDEEQVQGLKLDVEI